MSRWSEVCDDEWDSALEVLWPDAPAESNLSRIARGRLGLRRSDMVRGFMSIGLEREERTALSKALSAGLADGWQTFLGQLDAIEVPRVDEWMHPESGLWGPGLERLKRSVRRALDSERESVGSAQKRLLAQALAPGGEVFAHRLKCPHEGRLTDQELVALALEYRFGHLEFLAGCHEENERRPAARRERDPLRDHLAVKASMGKKAPCPACYRDKLNTD